MDFKVTENEFRELCRTALYSGFDRAIAEARSKGLEFAPEPIKLPERLALDSRGFIQPENAPVAVCGWNTEEQRQAVYEAARDRYNAYPGLRLALERVVVAARMTSHDRFSRALAEAESELAKGPK